MFLRFIFRFNCRDTGNSISYHMDVSSFSKISAEKTFHECNSSLIYLSNIFPGDNYMRWESQKIEPYAFFNKERSGFLKKMDNKNLKL